MQFQRQGVELLVIISGLTQQIFIDPGLTLIYSLKQFTDASNSAQKETVLTSLGSDGAYRE